MYEIGKTIFRLLLGFHFIFKKFFHYSFFALVFPLILSSSGCVSLGYLIQAGKGQLELSNRAKPISEVLKDEKTPFEIKNLLAQVDPIKKMGETYGLKPTKNYTEYVELNRSAAVWVVSACEPLEFKSKEWNFPIVGSFTYLGWFDESGARKFGKVLKAQGFDVSVRGASAYSTIGWFRDAVLSTMISRGGGESLGGLVNVILHESVHATLYLKDQVYFNESIASFVADQLTPVYLKKSEHFEQLQAYQRAEKTRDEQDKVLNENYLALEKIYASPLSQEEKLERKSKILKNVKEKLELKRDINNATLIKYRTYGVGKAEFQAVLDSCGSDWKRFWSVMKKLKTSDFLRSHTENIGELLLGLAKRGCGS